MPKGVPHPGHQGGAGPAGGDRVPQGKPPLHRRHPDSHVGGPVRGLRHPHGHGQGCGEHHPLRGGHRPHRQMGALRSEQCASCSNLAYFIADL